MEFNKSLFDNKFHAIGRIYDQSEKMFTAFMDKAAWLPDDGKKAITAWVSAYKKGLDDFKTATNDKYQELVNYLDYLARVQNARTQE